MPMHRSIFNIYADIMLYRLIQNITDKKQRERERERERERASGFLLTTVINMIVKD